MLIIALACFYPVFINAYYGVKATPKILVWSAQNMGASRAAIFRRVVVPSAAPMIFAAMRVSLALSFIVMFAAEMINARSGLGYMIREAENSLRFDLMYVSLLAIAILGYAGDRLVRYSHAQARLARAAGMRFLFIGMALVAWEAAARSGLWSKILFPSLVNIGREFLLFFTREASLMEAWTSLYRALGGFAFAAAVGIFLGILMGRSKTAAGLLDPLFSGTYAVPKLALFPIFIFVFGIGAFKVALIFLECLYPIVIMSYAGARSVNRVLLWSAQNMGASRAEIAPRRNPGHRAVHLRRFPRGRAGSDDRGGYHRDGELGRRPGLPRDLFALVAAHRPDARRWSSSRSATRSTRRSCSRATG